MKRILSLALAAFSAFAVSAQTDVTKQYIQNPDFAARFAGWVNPGSFNYSVGTNFTGKSGEVFMEKWISSGKLGTNSGIYQTLRHLPEGTYTLVLSAQNVQQTSTLAQTGAYVYAGNEQTTIQAAGDYSVVFTVPEGTTLNIGVKLTSCTGNWVAIDNFRLYKKAANADSLATETARLNAETEDLKSKIENGTGSLPTVTTNHFMALGSTIILARSKVTLNGASILEQGYCWTTDPYNEPTIFDDKTTVKFTDTGNLYRLEGLQPATAYYVRPYVITKGYKVAYGETVKAPTMPAGTVTYGFDYAATSDTQYTAAEGNAANWRINSGIAETVWMYNNLSWINGLYLNVHYVRGAGAGTGTADCSYGGWMRVSQATAYQQTGTMLHETNHGVGVGTTSEWYSNSYLRSNTSSGKWLGPRATKMVQFLNNNDAAFMQGDATHMWAGTTDGSSVKYGFGINGAQEDSYQPSNQLLYFGNILITHALHQDGLISTSSRGFITPAYTLPQVDGKKYYIQIEDVKKGLGIKYLTVQGSSLVLQSASAEEAKADDSYAWNISYDPTTCLYSFYNVGLKKYISGSFIAGSNPGQYQILPSRVETVLEGSEGHSFTGQSYWLLKSSNSYTPATLGVPSEKPVNTTFDFGNDATTQRWLFLDEEEIVTLEDAASHVDLTELKEMLEKVKALKDVPHTELTEGVGETFQTAIETVENEMSTYRTADDVEQAKTALITASIDFTEKTTTSLYHPYDITFMLTNPTVETSSDGWTCATAPTISNNCAEFYQTAFDFYQKLPQKMGLGTYVVKVQAFERPGSTADTYAAFPEGSTYNKGCNAKLYLKTNSNARAIDNIWSDSQTKSLGTGSTSVSGHYVPNNRASAASWFDAGLYENEYLYCYNRGSSRIDMNLGLVELSSKVVTSDWTCFRNFRLYYYGKQTITGIDDIAADVDTSSDEDNSFYDLTGRRISQPQNGIYIHKGKKVLVK